METSNYTLPSFFKGLSFWPKTESELSSVSERIQRLLNVPFAAVLSLLDETAGGRSGPAFGNFSTLPQGLGGLENAALSDFILKQTIPLQENGHPKLIWLDEESALGRAMNPARHLTFASIPGSVRTDFTGLDRLKGEAGWIVIASEKALSPKEEILLFAAAQKLSELAKVAQLEIAIQLRNQFLSIASHELKTPLTSIYGILQLQDRMSRLKQQATPETPQTAAQGKSYLKILLRQVERMNELIDGLLDVSRIQNGRFMVEPSESDVAALLRETIQGRLQVISQEAGVKLHAEAPDSLVASIDPVRMEEVITNLVMNAIRFSPEGGVVWIKLREFDGTFKLTVRDQGPGVPAEDRDRIFKPFERAQRTARLGGLGLGLYISRQIALLHGGNVSLVESVPGKGNVFEATFPLRIANAISA